jgi:hypothetical protein
MAGFGVDRGSGSSEGGIAGLAATTGAALVGADDGSSGSLFTTVQGFITRLLSSAGAALVGFVASGSGAIATTAQDELRRVLRPEHYGAAADGTTDDAAAFTAANVVATASATGGEIRCQAGKTYKISTNVTLDSDVTLWFEDGARLSIDVGITFTAPGAVISFGGVPFTGSGTFTADFGKLCLTPGGSLGVGTTNPNVHAGDDGTTTRVISVMARTAPLFLGITDRTPTAGNSIVSFEGYTTEQAAPHDELVAIRGIFEGATAGQVGGAIGFLTKDNASASFTEKMRIHDHGDVLIGGGVASANRSGQGSTARVVTISGTALNGFLELATNQADASGVVTGETLFIHNQNTTGEKRVARIQAITAGATATDRGGQLKFYTKVDGGALTERATFTDLGTFLLNTSITANNDVAIPAGGTAGNGLMVSSTGNFGVFFGSGAPSLSAAQGSLYLRSDGSSTSTRLYVNTDGSTGWTNVVTAT